MADITKLDWKLNIEITRRQAKAMVNLGEFIGNIENDIKKDFPIASREIAWHEIRSLFSSFETLYQKNNNFEEHLQKFKIETPSVFAMNKGPKLEDDKEY